MRDADGLANKVVAAVLADLEDRGGFDEWWGGIDEATKRGLRRDLVKRVADVLDKPAIVGTPWTTPLHGDKCTREDGKSREALSVRYRHGWRHEFRTTPAKDFYPDLIDYRDEKGHEASCSASSWANWCRACRAGGTYERGPEAQDAAAEGTR